MRLAPYLRVTAIRFTGNTEWDSESWVFGDLIEESEFKVGDAVNDVMIKRTKEKLIKKYDKYYPFTTVDAKVIPDGAGGATVEFAINEGYATKVRHIGFHGNAVMSDYELRHEMETATWAWTFDTAYFPSGRFLKFSWLTGWGRFHKEEFRTDLEKLRDYYRNQGFLDVEIPDKAAEENYVQKWDDVKKGRLDVIVKITEGRRYAVGSMSVDGNALGGKFPRFKSDAILKVLAQRKRDVYKPYPYGDRVLDYLFGKHDESNDEANPAHRFRLPEGGRLVFAEGRRQARHRETPRLLRRRCGYLDCRMIRVERKPCRTSRRAKST